MMTNKKYSYVVFDIGNVLMKFCPRECLKEFCSAEKADQIVQEVFHQPEFRAYEKGEYTNEELIFIYSKRFPDNKEIITWVINHWEKLNQYMEKSWKLLKQIKKNNLRIYLLSTMGKEWKENLFDQYNDFLLADGSVFSYEVKANKPDKQIYNALFKKYNLIPEEGLFLDDSETNIIQAKNMGLNGIVFVDKEDVYNKIMEELGID